MTGKQPKACAFGSVVVTNAAAQAIGGAPGRRSLTLTAVGGNIFISNRPDVSVTTGLKITDGQVATLLCACHVGGFVCENIFAIGSGASQRLNFIEGFEEWPETKK